MPGPRPSLARGRTPDCRAWRETVRSEGFPATLTVIGAAIGEGGGKVFVASINPPRSPLSPPSRRTLRGRGHLPRPTQPSMMPLCATHAHTAARCLRGRPGGRQRSGRGSASRRDRRAGSHAVTTARTFLRSSARGGSAMRVWRWRALRGCRVRRDARARCRRPSDARAHRGANHEAMPRADTAPPFRSDEAPGFGASSICRRSHIGPLYSMQHPYDHVLTEQGDRYACVLGSHRSGAGHPCRQCGCQGSGFAGPHERGTRRSTLDDPASDRRSAAKRPRHRASGGDDTSSALVRSAARSRPRGQADLRTDPRGG